MSKILIIGDLHFGIRNCNDSIMYHQKKFFNFLFKYMEENSINQIYQLGDTWDSRRQINFKALNFAYNSFFDVLKEKGISYHTLIGNHDIYFKEAFDIHSPRLLLKNYENVYLYDEPTEIKIDNFKCCVIPWICEYNKEKCLKFIENSTSDFCFGHFEINTFEVVPGAEFTEGLNPSFFSKFRRVFSGHFHQRSERDNITYVGTPYQLNWGDTYNSKVFYVLDTETLEVEMVENDDDYFVNVIYDDKDKENTTNLDEVNIENSFIKLFIKNKNEAFTYNLFVGKLYSKNPADVKFIESSIFEDDKDIEIDTSNLSIDDLIKKYVDEKTNFGNKEQLKNFLLMLYNEAINSRDE